MTGLAQTSNFAVGDATVMLGAMDDLDDLMPETHGIGLVKNFTISSDVTYLELTQGVKNSVVYSVLNGVTTKATMEVYEYTLKNLAYALGLDGSGYTLTPGLGSVKTAAIATDTTLVLDTGDGASFTVGDFVAVEVDTDDGVLVRKVTTIATDTLTLDSALPVPVAVGSAVRKVKKVGIGSKTEQPFLAAKIVGKLADGTTVVIMLPKVRITKGFSLAFSDKDYGNLPIELTVYDLVSTDTNYTAYKDAPGALYRA